MNYKKDNDYIYAKIASNLRTNNNGEMEIPQFISYNNDIINIKTGEIN